MQRSVLVAFSAGCGITVGNVYLCQPLLHEMAVSFGVTEQAAGLVAVASQAGYVLGILFILPLADAIDPRRLLRVLLLLTTLSLVGAAFAPTISALALASLAFGTTTVVPQLLIPFTSGLVEPRHRGRVIGALQTGLVLGILLTRTASGGVAEMSGSWRAPYMVAALLTGGLFLLLPQLMPQRPRQPGGLGYFALMRSLASLLAIRPLRLSMVLGFCVFGAFSAFWATLAFHLSSPAFALGPAAIGLFGLYGAPGALLSPMAGRLSDRYGAFWVNVASLVFVMVAFVLAGWLGAISLLALILAVNFLDFGLQSGQVANQTRILTVGDGIRARINTVYMVATYGGGAFGSLAGAFAWTVAGWKGVCGLSLGLVLTACITLALMRSANEPA
ncbi:MFS transporter [Aquabacter sp. CN5-332]|uniref:MFS transporter n=1 Tax=Aquabacter sp. CN5-332 TaxID=3156608 RepID=UPI0032B3B660